MHGAALSWQKAFNLQETLTDEDQGKKYNSVATFRSFISRNPEIDEYIDKLENLSVSEYNHLKESYTEFVQNQEKAKRSRKPKTKTTKKTIINVKPTEKPKTTPKDPDINLLFQLKDLADKHGGIKNLNKAMELLNKFQEK